MGYLFMPEVIPPTGEEHLFGPTDKLLIVKSGRTITQEQGWTSLRLDFNVEEEPFLQLRGLGLKIANHPLEETNIYQMYPQTDPSSLPLLETVVKEDLRAKGLWKVREVEYNPLLRDNKYFGEPFCNPATEAN